MHVILVRHAEAVNVGEEGVATDFDRPLTAHGREQAANLAAAFKSRGILPSVVVTSPLVRARQTAEPLLAVLATPATDPLICDYLAVGELKRRKLTKFVEGLHADAAVLVGHNPDLSEYAEWLIGADPGAIPLEKAAAAAFRFDGDVGKGRGALEWLVTPGWFMDEKDRN
jgi:phosphohistidine phosphatase